MYVVNVVLSSQNGGLERASLDYVSAFLRLEHKVSLIVRNTCQFADEAQALGCEVHFQPNRFGLYDPVAMWELRRWVKQEKPDIIFAHGNRAISLMRRAVGRLVPVVAVNHTSRVRRSVGSDAVIVVNATQKADVLRLGHRDMSRVFIVPNMVTITDNQRRKEVSPAPRDVPVLGVLSRFWEVKGVDVFIRAVAELKRRGIVFHARIGGDGILRERLDALSRQENLGDVLEFVGWVKDRNAFYDSIDIFCLPSRSETFGIVVLEAFQHKVPVVATRTIGPLEISEGREVVQFVPSEDSMAFADAVQELLRDWQKSRIQAAAAFSLLEEKYDVNVVAGQLRSIIEEVTDRWKKAA